MELSARHAAALDRSITPTRMGTYLAAAHGDANRARELYLWDRELAVAFLGDLAILEVALRNAMSARLDEAWGCPYVLRQEERGFLLGVVVTGKDREGAAGRMGFAAGSWVRVRCQAAVVMGAPGVLGAV